MFKKKPDFMKYRWVRFIASVRFAIPILFVFAGAMTIGTICESLYGTEWVRRGIYHTWWFYLIQASIAAAVFLAMVDRIPPRKRLIGFYVVHTGLLTIMAGAVATHYWGIDGSLELTAKSPSSSVRLNEDYVYLFDGKREHSYRLPDVVTETPIKGYFRLASGAVAHLTRYIPYAAENPKWVAAPGAWGTSWLLKNSRVEQQVDLADLPDRPAQADLGPLRIAVVPAAVIEGLRSLSASRPGDARFLLVDERTKRGFAVAENAKDLAINLGSETIRVTRMNVPNMNMTFYQLDTARGKVRFFPRFSIKPVTSHLEIDRGSPLNLLDLGSLSDANTVLLARAPEGRILLAMGRRPEFRFAEYKGEAVELPWMGFTLTLLSEHVDARPERGFAPGRPNREEEKNTKALLVRLEKDGRTEELWLTNREPARSPLGLQEAFIGTKEIKLPFALQLERFKMDVVPGTTDRPASYESFARVSGLSKEPESVHIYMNNPLKKLGYTLYQASYLQDEQGAYHSILSVNKDPGRPIKYAGSLLLVLGLILHFLIIYGYIRVN